MNRGLIALALLLALPAMAQSERLAVTVYNENLGLVRDIRTVQLTPGVQNYKFTGVSAQINPASVLIKSLTSPGTFTVLEQNYEYDLLTPAKLLDKYVGQKITLVLREGAGDKTQLIPTEAVLLANNEGAVWQINNQIVINPTNIAEVRFPQLPTNLISRPTLVLKVDNDNKAPQQIEVSYLTGGMDWKADYVLLLAPKENQGDLTAWVTINNQSGAEYPNAKLQLVAGQINRVTPDQEGLDLLRDNVGSMQRKTFAPALTSEALSEYYLYTLDRPTTLNNNQTKQISLLEQSGIAITKEFILNGRLSYFQNYINPEVIPEKVGVYYSFTNSQKNKLGQPLPAGIVRVYKSDTSGGQQFLGESRIEHTPREEEVTIQTGEAFDLVAERKQTSYQRINDKITEYGYEIKLRNRKPDAVTIQVKEPLFGDWTILKSSFPFQKTNAFLATFKIPVPAGREVILSYQIRVKS